MTEIVTTFSCEYHFQYVERRYSGFVALSFVVAVDTGDEPIRNERLKTPKKSSVGTSGNKCRHSEPKSGRLIKLGLNHGNH
jgi:hypothetical protein